MKLQYSFPTAFMSTEPPYQSIASVGICPLGGYGGNRYLKTKKKTSEELFIYKMSSSEDVAEFGDILRISSTEPPD